MAKSLQEIYDGFAQTYEQNRGIFDMTEVLRRFYTALGTQRGVLLDLGYGAGEPFGRFFLDHGWQVTGVDFSAKMLDAAAKAEEWKHNPLRCRDTQQLVLKGALQTENKKADDRRPAYAHEDPATNCHWCLHLPTA